ncbi:uncharacterized protein MYCGRDRAFT_109984 [Zymoseptoria tritici IPO323]|uniref:Uncharacterized protein n=1 Tax=Zymoseptoria tritici (strain CBS 115943 / IPO323) TaxID=336722 RepID=F9XE14_ZYMTI|nr:uncharacterized protein MYCGRDRAFT_109984 [Zymoseptoria tritici IPO323]EGP86710.1 hypothetical protein MYCGRDRAFT_109984 [Zymoseptoria tritici IPO323]
MKLSAVLALIPLAVALPNLHIERDDTEGNLAGHHPPGVGHHPQGSGIKPYYLEWHYSNNFVTVGDTNLFQAISQVGSTRGDGTGIQTDDTYKAYGADKACVYKEEYDPNLDVTVKLSGEWGVVSGIDGFTVRNQLVKSMMDLVEQIQEADGDIWKDCAQSCGPIGGCSDDPSALCGGHRPAVQHFGMQQTWAKSILSAEYLRDQLSNNMSKHAHRSCNILEKIDDRACASMRGGQDVITTGGAFESLKQRGQIMATFTHTNSQSIAEGHFESFQRHQQVASNLAVAGRTMVWGKLTAPVFAS